MFAKMIGSSGVELTLDEHPARDNVHGTLVPMFPQQKMIRINGMHAGYLSLISGGVSMCRRYPDAVLDDVKRFAAQQLMIFGKDGMDVVVSQPPERVDLDTGD